MNITLYSMPDTRSIRPRWLMEEMGIPYELKAMNLYAGEGNTKEYRALNPWGLVPTMKINDEVLLESGAMCHWLADNFPEKGFAPSHDDPQRRVYEQWMYFVSGTLEPPIWIMIVHSRILPEPKRVTEIVPWCIKNMHSILKPLETELQERTFITGDTFTAADIMLGSTLTWIKDALSKYPALLKYTDQLMQRDAYKRARID